jgi:hypothetical protein
MGLQVQALRGRGARPLQVELARAVVAARAADLSETEARAHRFLSLIQYENQDFAAAEESSIRHAEAGRGGEGTEAAVELAASARCFALLEREIARAEVLIEEASEAFGRDAQVLDVFWTRGLLRHFNGDSENAVADLARAVTLAANAELNWEQCDCLMRLALIEIERRRPADALPWCARLAAVASKMSDGYERPVAATMTALAHKALGRAGSAEEVTAALADLRAADAMSVLSTALNLSAEMTLEAGETAAAEAFAREALEAATVVQHKSQLVIARALLARLAGAAAEPAAARDHLDAVAGDLAEPRLVSARARAAVDTARAELSQNQAIA